MRALKRRLIRIGTFLLYGGTTRIRRYEQAILTRLLEMLSEGDRRALTAQLDSLDHLKRLHDDRMVTFYFFERSKLPLLGNTASALKLAAFRLIVGEPAIIAAVYAHKGLLSSIEFSRSPKALTAPLQVTLASQPEAAHSIAQDVDAKEHGRNA